MTTDIQVLTMWQMPYSVFNTHVMITTAIRIFMLSFMDEGSKALIDIK